MISVTYKRLPISQTSEINSKHSAAETGKMLTKGFLY